MSLRTPRLDDLTFQNLVDELKSRIPLYCPEWTDHNVSDPGVTLIELFAFMAEQLLYRMNQVPDLHYWKFVRFLGIPIPTPQPARVPVTFWLSQPLTAPAGNGTGVSGDPFVPIPAGTKVSTVRTEMQEPLFFLVERDAKIVTPRLVHVRKASRDDAGQLIPAAALSMREEGMGVELFAVRPRDGDQFVFYFDDDVSYHILQLQLDLDEKQGRNIHTDQPPFAWEAYVDNGVWRKIRREDVEDVTMGLNVSGTVRLYLPKLARLTGRTGTGSYYAVRVRVEREEYGQSPRLLRLHPVAALGLTQEAAYQQQAEDELLGVSDGSPGQRFRLRNSPIILPLEEGETLVVEGKEWQYVETFAWPQPALDAGAPTAGKVFTIDVFTNEVCLPPAIRRSNGEIVVYGAVPVRSAALSFKKYRFGGGVIDVPRGVVNTLKSSIPYIDRVENRQPALGGQQDILDTDALRMEVERYLRIGSRDRLHRAVTAEDYEQLVRFSFPEQVGKVECRLEQSGSSSGSRMVVYVTGKIPVSGLLSGQSDFSVPDDVIAQIDQLLYGHRLLTVRVRASNPQFVPLDVDVSLTIPQNRALEERMQTIAAAYLNPLSGGNDGFGWPLDRLCSQDDLERFLSTVLRDTVKLHKLEIKVDDPRFGSSDPLLTIVDHEAKDTAQNIMSSLDRGVIPAQLANQYRTNERTLSSQARLEVKVGSALWRIDDQNKKLVIHRDTQNNALQMYDFSNHPAEVYILRSLRVNFE